MTAAEKLSEVEVCALEHMVGAKQPRKTHRGYRNVFAAGPADRPMMLRLAAFGYVKRGREIPGGLSYFHATRKGCIAAGLHPAAVRRAMEGHE